MKIKDKYTSQISTSQIYILNLIIKKKVAKLFVPFMNNFCFSYPYKYIEPRRQTILRGGEEIFFCFINNLKQMFQVFCSTECMKERKQLLYYSGLPFLQHFCRIF